MSHVQAYKNGNHINSARNFVLDGRHADCDRRLEAAGPGDGWFRRKTLSVGLRPLPCQRRVGVDPRGKCWTEHRILVNVLADKAGKRMGALGYGCSSSDDERPQWLVDLAQVDRLPFGQVDNRATRGDRAQAKRHHLCCNIPYAWRPHRQCCLVSEFNRSDAASRVYLDQLSRWTERQCESIEGSRAQAYGYAKTTSIARRRYGRIRRWQRHADCHARTHSGTSIFTGPSEEFRLHHFVR